MAQISTSIIVACCPYLRPLFEKIMPRRLIRLSSLRPVSVARSQEDPEKNSVDDATPRQDSHQAGQGRSRTNSITVTTTIEVHPSAPSPSFKPMFHDGHEESWTQTVKVEAKPEHELPETPGAGGLLRGCNCC